MKKNEQPGRDVGWSAIFARHPIGKHDFAAAPFYIKGAEIKEIIRRLSTTTARELRTVCIQTKREDRPQVFVDNGLFILPVKNGDYVVVRGEGYVDIPRIKSPIKTYDSKLHFMPRSVSVGDSEMQHLDYAYAVSMLRDFIGDPTMVLTIRGRKRTPAFSFNVGDFRINAEEGIQVEVDGGYEGKSGIVVVEAKNTAVNNTIIRQLYYPYRQWKINTGLPVSVVFFQKNGKDEFHFREFVFDDEDDYNSIRLKRSARYRLSE